MKVFEMEKQQIQRVEKRAELAVRNNVNRDKFWEIMLDTYGYTLASIALERYDNIMEFMEDCN